MIKLHLNNILFLLGVSFFCISFIGCGIIPQTELQDASTLEKGQSTISITPSPFFECRYQVGIAERSDISVTGYANAFVFFLKWYETGLKFQWKQTLSSPMSKNKWALLFSGQAYATRFKYGGLIDGPPDNEAKFEAVSPSFGIIYSREVNFDPFKDWEDRLSGWRLFRRFPWLKVQTIYLGIKTSWMYSEGRYHEIVNPSSSLVSRQDVFVFPFVGIVAGERGRFRIEIGAANYVNTYEHAPRIIFYPSVTMTYPLGEN